MHILLQAISFRRRHADDTRRHYFAIECRLLRRHCFRAALITAYDDVSLRLSLPHFSPFYAITFSMMPPLRHDVIY